MKPKTFKFRAETLFDVGEFLKHFPVCQEFVKFEIMNITPHLPDIECHFVANVTLNQVRHAMRNIVDGHVMVQTVQPIKKYTGERDYNL
jgi:hypothetical protein